MSLNQSIYRLDVSGHKCPIPVLRLRRMMDKMKPKEMIELKATDPMTLIDVPNYCREAGHKMVSITEKGDYILYLLEIC